jgi:hypothetical protein
MKNQYFGDVGDYGKRRTMEKCEESHEKKASGSTPYGSNLPSRNAEDLYFCASQRKLSPV